MRAALRIAIDEIVLNGKTQRQAATASGMNETALSRALAKPHVNAYVEAMKAEVFAEAEQLKGRAKAIAIREGINLLRTAKSESVRARMVEFFAGEPKQSSVNVQVNTGAAGYVYTRPSDRPSVADDAQPIEIEGKASPVDE